MNTLDDLVREYVRADELLGEMIEHGNALMQRARAFGDRDRVYKLRNRQQDLYLQRTHVREIARTLRNYYGQDAAARIQ